MMSLFYVLLGALVVWLLYRWLSRASRATVSEKPEPVEIPINISVTYGRGSRGDSLGTISTRREETDKDEWEGSFWEVTQPLPARATLRLKYTDGAGRKTERTVDVRQFGAMGPTSLLIGHCRMRNATRTFRTDRIQSCIDEETGEVVRDIRAYLLQRYEESPDKTKDLLLEGEYDTLRVLLYIGKADGQLRAAEKSVVKDTCIAITKDSRLTERAIDELFLSMDVPTLQAFKLAVGRLAKRDTIARSIVMSAAEKMVATQKTVHQAEQEALDYMKKRFVNNTPNAA